MLKSIVCPGRLPLVALLLLAGASGCGGDPIEKLRTEMGAAKDPETLRKLEISVIKEITNILNGIKDDASAEAAIPRLKKAFGLSKELLAKQREFPGYDFDTLNEKLRSEWEPVMKELPVAMKKAKDAAPGKRKELFEALSKE